MSNPEQWPLSHPPPPPDPGRYLGDGIELDPALVSYRRLQKNNKRRSQRATRFHGAGREEAGQSRATRIDRAAIDF